MIEKASRRVLNPVDQRPLQTATMASKAPLQTIDGGQANVLRESHGNASQPRPLLTHPA